MVPQPIRLLHVEDDQDILEIAMMSLEMAGGFEVLQCDNGAEALARAPGFAPDIMIFDLMMPEMSGTQLLVRMRELPALATVPVIFMTARAQPHEKRDLMEKGAVDVIVKPFDPVTLGDQIKAIMARAG